MRNLQKEIGWLLKEKHNGQKTEQFYKDIERLNAGEPLDYVIGFTEFLGCKIDLSRKPLIPRIETEFWVNEVVVKITRSRKFNDDKNIRVLDMFAGSGCIGIAISRHVKNAKIDFADKYKYFNSPNFIKSDIFSNIKNKYDYIFANPPYIPATRIKKLPKAVLNFEPKSALFGGSDGLYYINKFLSQAKNHLDTNGKIFMEFDGSAGASTELSRMSSPQVLPQKKEIEKLIEKYKYSNFEFFRDQFGRWRWVVII